MRAPSCFDSRNSRFGVWLALCLLALLGENLLFFPLSVPWMNAISKGLPLLDMHPGFTPADVSRLFDALGAGGREQYLHLLWSIDLVLPALIGKTLFEALPTVGRWRWLAVFAAGSDYAENLLITGLLLAYPHLPHGWTWLPGSLTSLKFGLYFAAAALALLLEAKARRQIPAGFDAD